MDFVLLAGADEASLKAACLLSIFDIPFKVIDGTCGLHIPHRGLCAKPPVLEVSLERAGVRGYQTAWHAGLGEIKDYLRRYVLKTEDSPNFGLLSQSAYTPWHGFNFPYVERGIGLLCFNRKNEEVYRGPATKSVFPIDPVLTSIVGKDHFSQACAWEICEVDDKDFTFAGTCGHPYVNRTVPAVLMPEEAYALAQSKYGKGTQEILIAHDHVLAHSWYESYFVQQNTLYRLWAHNPD